MKFSSKVPAWHVWGPGFDPQHRKKKKVTIW
jgi:hypothetical protein